MHTETEEYAPVTVEPGQPAHPDVYPRTRLSAISFQFLRRHRLALPSISVFLLIPCFWHRYIVAGDLDSHVYNAWLVQLIERGQAPGLWIARQWDNILFDMILSNLGNIFGMHAAERVGVVLCVLIFFWGAFSLIAAATHRAPWFLIPCLAMLTFGWTFEMGFFNYYLSLGLSFFALAIVWRGRRAERLLALALVPFIGMAHPLGLVWFVGAAGYITLARLASGRGQIFLLAGAAVSLAILGRYLSIHFAGGWASIPGLAANGSDQLLLMNESRYRLPARLLFVFGLTCLMADFFNLRREHHTLKQYRLPLQLYIIAIMGVSILPGSIQLPQFTSPATLLTERFSSIAAILGCCLLGMMKPRKWHLIGFAGIAAIYFSFLYQDTFRLTRIEQQAERLVSTLPNGARVTSATWTSSDIPLLSNHVVDRACIGRCFSYSNYEPSSGQFRVRALPGNRIVASSAATSMAMQLGSYTVLPQDLPLFQISFCQRNSTELCLRELAAGPPR
jgi:hypothetical protein